LDLVIQSEKATTQFNFGNVKHNLTTADSNFTDTTTSKEDFFSGEKYDSTITDGNFTETTSKEDFSINNIHDSVTVVVGEDFSIAGYRKFLLGENRRKLWLTPLKLPVLNLNSFSGGLTVIKVDTISGNRTLYFSDKMGKKWKFRSLEKFLEPTLSDTYAGTYIGWVLQDNTSGLFPGAEVALTPILDALGLPNSHPAMWVLPSKIPDDSLPSDTNWGAGKNEPFQNIPELLESINGFQNMPGVLEKIGGFQNMPGVLEEVGENNGNYLTTKDVVFGLLNGSNAKVEATEYLKMRLLDILINNFGRDANSLCWESHLSDNYEKVKFHPVLINYENAFADFDGLVPLTLSFLHAERVSFNEDFPSAKTATYSGRHFDRRFLTELTKAEWDSVTNFVVSCFSSQLIEAAISALPPEYRLISADELRAKLINRVLNLAAISNDFYELTNKIAHIYCTNKSDSVSIYSDDSTTTVSLFRCSIEPFQQTNPGAISVRKEETPQENRNAVEVEGKPYFHKVFNNRITQEIRIYLEGGDDVLITSGESGCAPKINIDERSFKEKLADFHNSQGSANYQIKNEYQSYPDTLEYIEPSQRQEGTRFSIYPVADISSIFGLQLGGGPIFYWYGFRKFPWESKIMFYASYATASREYDVDFAGWFNSVIDGATVWLKACKKSIDFNLYYGFGNETEFSKAVFNDNGYRLYHRLLGAEVGLNIPLFGKLTNFYSLKISDYHAELEDSSLLSGFPGGTYGLGKLSTLSLEGGLQLDSRDNPELPYSGLFIRSSGSISPQVFNSKGMFWRANFDFRGYLPLGLLTGFLKNSTFAIRILGDKVGGDYPFYSASFLGSSKNLRSYRNERFSGDASLYATAELRFELGTVKTIVNSKMGVFFFTEAGRVYKNGESSDLWHAGNGVGLYAAPPDRSIVITGTVGFSSEYVSFFLGTNLNF